MIKEIVEIMVSGEKCYHGWLKEVYKRKIRDLVKNVNENVGDIRTKSITETKNIINATTTFVTKKSGLFFCGIRQKEREEP